MQSRPRRLGVRLERMVKKPRQPRAGSDSGAARELVQDADRGLEVNCEEGEAEKRRGPTHADCLACDLSQLVLRNLFSFNFGGVPQCPKVLDAEEVPLEIGSASLLIKENPGHVVVLQENGQRAAKVNAPREASIVVGLC